MTAVPLKIPTLVKCKHRESMKWIPLTDDSVCFLGTKNESFGGKKRKLHFGLYSLRICVWC